MSVSLPVILLLAAGESRRYGGIKQLALFDGEPMLRRTARMALATGVPVVAVLGAHAEQVRTAIADLSLPTPENPAWAEGMGASIAEGMRYIAAQIPAATGVLVTLADQPLIDSEALQEMIRRHRDAPDRLLATAQHGTVGPPALVPRDCFAALGACRGDTGARALLKAMAGRVEVSHQLDIIDVDTPADLALAEQMLRMRRGQAG